MRHSPKFLRLIVFFTLAGIIIGGTLSRPLQAGVWGDLKEWYLLFGLSGGGKYLSYQRNVDTKDPNFPLMVLSDGYKMVRVYQDLPGVYMVEWAWRMTVKSSTVREVSFTPEYKLQDKDLFLVTSSMAPTRTILSGQTVTVEKTEILPYEKVKPVENSNWYLHLK
jgi:hypothetical protein